MSAEIPDGFTRSQRTGPFFDLIGPIYTNPDESGILLGLRARTEHCNARGFVHAAVLAALLDVVCGRNCQERLTVGARLVTVSLTVDYLSSANDGDWLEASATVIKAGDRAGRRHGSRQTVHRAWVGDRRAARMAGGRPARAPMSRVAARPPAQASGEMTMAQLLAWA
jgi:uncharacterized protein (TIGR00369 family)